MRQVGPNLTFSIFYQTLWFQFIEAQILVRRLVEKNTSWSSLNDNKKKQISAVTMFEPPPISGFKTFAHLICTLESDLKGTLQKHLRFSRVATWEKAGFHKVN